MELGPGRSARHSPAEPARAVQPPNGPSGSEPPSQGCAIDATHLLPQRAVRTSKSGPGPGAGTYTATRDYHDFASTRAGPHSLCIPPNPTFTRAGHWALGGTFPQRACQRLHKMLHSRAAAGTSGGGVTSAPTQRADSDPAPGGSGKIPATIACRPRLTTESLGSYPHHRDGGRSIPNGPGAYWDRPTTHSPQMHLIHRTAAGTGCRPHKAAGPTDHSTVQSPHHSGRQP